MIKLYFKNLFKFEMYATLKGHNEQELKAVCKILWYPPHVCEKFLLLLLVVLENNTFLNSFVENIVIPKENDDIFIVIVVVECDKNNTFLITLIENILNRKKTMIFLS